MMTTLTGSDIRLLQRLVKDHSGVILENGKESLIEVRLLPLLQREGFPNLTALLAAVRGQPGSPLERRVAEAILINETAFFRDAHPFDALRAAVLPELIARRGATRRLAIWSAACSTGQEAYSVAMILREHFPQTLDWQLDIIASDLSQDSLERARLGRYTNFEANRGLPARLLVKHFDKDGLSWQIQKAVRDMVQFRTINLVRPWPLLPPMDIIFLRNILIYFEVPTRIEILARIRRLLRPDGILFLGAAETTITLDPSFELARHDRTLFYRLRDQQGLKP